MKNLFLVVLTFFALQVQTIAQTKKSKKKVEPKIAVIDSVKWRADHYIVDRDSAYLDPKLGLKKLMGGNKRFIEGKTIKPRQDAQTIKSLGLGQAPFATIVGCSDSRVPNEVIFV